MENDGFEQRIDRVREVFRNYRFFFVTGAPKSGTTWLQKALDAHPEIVCAGEGHFPDSFIRRISQPLRRYFSQQEVVVRNVYEGRAYYRYSPTREFGFLAMAFILNAFAQLEVSPGTRVIGDKTPANVDHLDLLNHLFPNAKFINIVRDGRDTLVSTIKHVERLALRDGARPGSTDEVLRTRIGNYTERWIRAVENAERFAAAHPGRLYTVRYEDMKTDFATSFGRVLEFLDVDRSPVTVQHCEAETSFKRLSGGRDAGEENPAAFFRKGVVGDWRTGLAPEHLEIFNRVGADCLVRLGYETMPLDMAASSPQ